MATCGVHRAAQLALKKKMTGQAQCALQSTAGLLGLRGVVSLRNQRGKSSDSEFSLPLLSERSYVECTLGILLLQVLNLLNY